MALHSTSSTIIMFVNMRHSYRLKRRNPIFEL
jgi:hypothetical protein